MIRAKYHTMTRDGYLIHWAWIPSHWGIWSNEKAEKSFLLDKLPRKVVNSNLEFLSLISSCVYLRINSLPSWKTIFILRIFYIIHIFLDHLYL